MTGDKRGGDDGRLAARVALGETGFERAAVWSAVGFAVSYVAFDAVSIAAETASALGGLAVPQALAAPVAGALAALTAVGVVAFTAVGGGVLPAALLAYGPLSAVLLRTTGPEPYAIPLADPAPFLVGVAEPVGLAAAAAVAVGLAGYAIGRVVGGLGGEKRDGRAASPDERADASD